jgi:hypothetical protein
MVLVLVLLEVLWVCCVAKLIKDVNMITEGMREKTDLDDFEIEKGLPPCARE